MKAAQAPQRKTKVLTKSCLTSWRPRTQLLKLSHAGTEMHSCNSTLGDWDRKITSNQHGPLGLKKRKKKKATNYLVPEGIHHVKELETVNQDHCQRRGTSFLYFHFRQKHHQVNNHLEKRQEEAVSRALAGTSTLRSPVPITHSHHPTLTRVTPVLFLPTCSPTLTMRTQWNDLN